MIYLFILESIGTSELILIGLVALVVFGPRKLPEYARTIGKMMSEFRRSTDDFKQTWAREVDFEGNEKISALQQKSHTENSIERDAHKNSNEISMPEIREIDRTNFQKSLLPDEIDSNHKAEARTMDKRDWL